MENQIGSGLRAAVLRMGLVADRSSSSDRKGCTASSPSLVRISRPYPGLPGRVEDGASAFGARGGAFGVALDETVETAAAGLRDGCGLAASCGGASDDELPASSELNKSSGNLGAATAVKSADGWSIGPASGCVAPGSGTFAAAGSNTGAATGSMRGADSGSSFCSATLGVIGSIGATPSAGVAVPADRSFFRMLYMLAGVQS